jgi:prolyl-tRNA synthetase
VDFEDAERQVQIAVEIYRKVYDALGLSYIILKRPDFDKFAGAVYTLAFDTWNPDGKSSQIGTVHNLGENFAKAFDITYEDSEGVHRHVSTTCYGMGFGRTLAATIAHHGDNNGLVLPPVVAPKQVVIIPIMYRGKEGDVIAYSKEIEAKLKAAGIRTVLDDDDRLRPGEKYYKWDMYGVPIRVEVGPREADARTATMVRRDNRAKSKASFDGLVEAIQELFDDLVADLKRRSRERLEEELVDAHSMDELKAYMEQRKIARVNWCGEPSCAFELKAQVAGEVRGTLWGNDDKLTDFCIVCRDKSKYKVYVSQTY